MNVTISKANHYNSGVYDLPKEGELIKLKYRSKKRYYLKVVKVIGSGFYERTFNCRTVYKAAPKSTLRNKSVFSKFKMEIV